MEGRPLLIVLEFSFGASFADLKTRSSTSSIDNPLGGPLPPRWPHWIMAALSQKPVLKNARVKIDGITLKYTPED